MNKHKAGFVSIIGKPNAGKSTLMNQLVGERLSIITAKAQTTRHRIMGIISGDEYQIVYSDTPGIIEPKYKLQESMMSFVNSSLEDADIILWVVDIGEKAADPFVLDMVRKANTEVILVVNKVDLSDQDGVKAKVDYWHNHVQAKATLAVSALHGFNTEAVLDTIIANLPEHPEYYQKDELTDKPERFFVSEIVREKIFLNYKQEIPYSSEVVVTSFKESEPIIRISVVIYVERDSQKGIIIGKGGSMLKKVGQEAREELERFFQKKVFLEQHVKVDLDWRSDPKKLAKYGYRN